MHCCRVCVYVYWQLYTSSQSSGHIKIVEMLIEASFDIVAALPSYYFGNTRVTSISHSSSSFDQKHMHVSFSVPASTSAGIKAIRVTFANGQADAVSIAIEIHRSLTSLSGRYCRCAFHKPVVDTITLHCLEMPWCCMVLSLLSFWQAMQASRLILVFLTFTQLETSLT